MSSMLSFLVLLDIVPRFRCFTPSVSRRRHHDVPLPPMHRPRHSSTFTIPPPRSPFPGITPVRPFRSASSSTNDDASSSRTCVLWLKTSLRLPDNEALRRAMDLGPDGLTVLFTWERESVPSTPSAVFECAAARSLDEGLRRLGNEPAVVRVDDDGGGTSSAVEEVRNVVRLLRPDSLVIDADSSENRSDAARL